MANYNDNEERLITRLDAALTALGGEPSAGGNYVGVYSVFWNKVFAKLDAIITAIENGGGGGGDIAGAIANHNAAADRHAAQFDALRAEMSAMLGVFTKTAQQIPSSAAGVVEYNHVIITPNADNTDVSLSVTHNASYDRLPYEILLYPVAATVSAIQLTLTLKKIGGFWHVKSVNTFLYRYSSAITTANFAVYAVNGLTGAAKANVTNAIAWYFVGQISGYPQLKGEGSISSIDFGADVTNTTGANLQNFCINNTV